LVYDSGSELTTSFRNDDAEKVIEMVIGNVMRFMMDADVQDYELLGQRALDHWRRRTKTAFGHGDIWFATMIVDPRGGYGGCDNGPVIGICDWEFAGPSHPAADIAQLGVFYMSLLLS